jgi:hypothetical protein
MDKSVQEIIADWKDQMSVNSSYEDKSVTYVWSKDILAVISYFEDIDKFEQSL